MKEAKRLRVNAQGRLRRARINVKAEEWAPERLEKAQRERAEAGLEQERAQAALDAWDACH